MSKQIIFINKIIVIVILILSAFNIIYPSFILRYSGGSGFMHYFEIHHAIMRMLSFIILIISWKLYKRISVAWNIVMMMLFLRILQFVHIHNQNVLSPLFLIEILCFFILLLSKNYYVRKVDKYSIKKAINIFFLYTVFVFFNATISVFRERGMVSFFDCVKDTVEIIFNLDYFTNSVLPQNSIYYKFIFGFSWICLVFGLVLFLAPYIKSRVELKDEKVIVLELVKKYGFNSSSYLSLEDDKIYFFGETVNGVVSYGIVGDIMIVLGELICDPKDYSTFLTEIKDFCAKNAYTLLFLNVTTKFLKEYEKLKMGYVKCGEEPMFYLPNYSLAGGKASKIRLNVNHATNMGIRVLEYNPNVERSLELEKEFLEVSHQWFSMKKSGELSFTMGSIGFDNPMDRRYFYGVNAENEVEGFIVFIPFGGMNGYMTDVTRHRKKSSRGLMEKIFYEAMMQFKDEGIEWGSLAEAPLARLADEPDVTAKLLNIIYEKMNKFYGFKALYQAKLKYNPTYWEPNYYVYYPPIFTPAMAYAIVKIQNPLGIKDYILSFFNNKKVEETNCDSDN